MSAECVHALPALSAAGPGAIAGCSYPPPPHLLLPPPPSAALFEPRFCQPGMLTRPARDVEPSRVVDAVEHGMRLTVGSAQLAFGV